MDIIHITDKIFEYEGVKHSTKVRRFVDFNDLQKYLDRAKFLNKTKFFLHSVETLPEQTELWVTYSIL
jgi:hypothetical protein